MGPVDQTYEVVRREDLSDATFLIEVRVPALARAARPGQFVIVMSHPEGERVPLTIADFDADAPAAVPQGRAPRPRDLAAGVRGRDRRGLATVAKKRTIRSIPQERTPMTERGALERARSFAEVACGYTAAEAVRESERCLFCPDEPCVRGCPVGIDIPASSAR